MRRVATAIGSAAVPVLFEINSRVISGHPIANEGCLLHPQERTCSASEPMSDSLTETLGFAVAFTEPLDHCWCRAHQGFFCIGARAAGTS